MNLTLRIIDGCAVPGGKAILLCDEQGEMLPMQVHAELRNGIDEAQVTVTFAIDGEKVRFE